MGSDAASACGRPRATWKVLFPSTVYWLVGVSAVLSSAFGAQEDPQTKEVGKDFEVRLAPRGGVVVLSRDRAAFVAACVRSIPSKPDVTVLSGNKNWMRTPRLGKEGKAIRPVGLSMRRSGGPAVPVTVLLRAQRTEHGVRVLVQPEMEVPPDFLAPENGDRKAGLPANGLPLELAIEVFPKPDKPKAFPELKEWGVLGKAGSRPPVPLPRFDGKDRFRAIRLSFGGKDARRVEVARSAPAAWTIKKLPTSLLLRQRLLPDPRDQRQPAAFVVYLGEKWDGGTPEISPLVLSKRRTPAGDFIEGAARVYAAGADPFGGEPLSVFAELAYPPRTGQKGKPRMKMLPCFFREGPTWRPAEGEFRFRFAPPESGVYGVRLIAIARGATVRGNALAFEAGPLSGRGMVGVRKGERVFRFADGTVYLPVGLNLAWPGKRGDVQAYRDRFRWLARNGGNAARVWLSTWGLPFEGPRAGRYDADVAEALDEVLLAAQARDIHIVFVMENAHDLTKTSKQHPYFREQGGPLVAPAEFFREERALKRFQRRLTYLSARYGAYRSVMAWELLNEVDEAWPALKVDPEDPRSVQLEADRARAARRTVLKWTRRMAQHLRSMDPHEHPITLSHTLPPTRPWSELEKLEELDFIQYHGYIPEATAAQDDLAFDSAAWISDWSRSARGVGRAHRPAWLTEFGYWALHDADLEQKGARGRAADRNALDQKGLLLHNALMSGIATGMAGAPLFWWWDRYIERHDLWVRFRGPSQFASSLAHLATQEGPKTLRPLSNEAEKDSLVGVLGQVGRQGMCVWVRDKRSTWARKLERKLDDPPQIEKLELALPALGPGAYDVRWLNAWTGLDVKTDRVVIAKVADGAPLPPFKLACPPFRRDIALIVTAARSKPQHP